MTKIFSSVLLLITLSCKGYANSFSAEYIRNYDGDTITLDLDCKIDYFCNNRSIRIYGAEHAVSKGYEEESRKLHGPNLQKDQRNSRQHYQQ